ncbi:hypothetical protein [Nocardiopsis suaedae]|uniref:TPM domain-containing protein n=1 Tax=Nocardiopsis suaedae TaxID=3018444 RepID=A0ABT4TR08_9ACTN|nr:hypothetical protein [Nocardiopsis suaedae]MDA2807131.1 hypothetical protein [Nocardiopsis suaedae]
MRDLPRRRSGPLRSLAACLLAAAAALAAPAAAAAEPADPPSPAAYLAGLLEEEPAGEAVVVSDLLAGAYDTDALAEQVRAEFSRTDTPFYAVVTPPVPGALDGDDLVAALRDRIGEEGLYVHLEAGRTTPSTAATPGVRLPMDDADTAMLGDTGLDYDSSPALIAEHYVDALLDPEIERKAEDVREDYGESGDPVEDGSDSDEESAFSEFLDEMRPDDTVGLGNLGFVSATAAGALLGAGGVAAFRRRGKGRPVLTAVAYLTGAVLVLGAGAGYAATNPEPPSETPPEASGTGSGDPAQAREEVPPEEALAAPPYVAETDRVDRVAAEMEDGSIPVDPLWPGERGDLAGLQERAARAPVPVYMASVLTDSHDESGGDTEVLAHALAHTVGEDGLYVVVDPRLSRPGFATRGVELPTSARSDLTEGVQEAAGDEAQTEASVAELLAPAVDAAQEAALAPEAEDSVPWAFRSLQMDEEAESEESRTAAFFAEGFFPGLLVVGPVLGALLYFAVVYLGRVGRFWVQVMAAAPGRRLRPMAHREVQRALKALEEAASDGPEVADATREADIALRVLRDGRADELDLAAAVVLARRAALRLDPATADTADRKVCMVNPLHGPSAGLGRSTLGRSTGQGDEKKPKGVKAALPMCQDCLDRSGSRLYPLRVRTGTGGARVPHLALDRIWVRREYGAQPIPDDPLEEEARAR